MENAVGEESCRDRPLYVRVTCCGHDNQNCWYVIEQKASGAESSSSSSLDEEEGDNDILEYKSESDIIRRLSIPDRVAL